LSSRAECNQFLHCFIFIITSSIAGIDHYDAKNERHPCFSIFHNYLFIKIWSKINPQIEGKLKFELNQGVIGAASLKVSTQLSSMAILI